MKKKLIFAFSVFEGCLENRAIKLHMKSLRHYSWVFDEALFVFMGDPKYSVDVMRELLCMGFKDIQFRFRPADGLWEAGVFYHEIIETNENDGKLCFFAHTKGITNYRENFCPESIDVWITSMYFFNLSDTEPIAKWLVSDTYAGTFFGSYLQHFEKDTIIFKGWIYTGTFYWANVSRIRRENKGIPAIFDRWWAERLPNYFSETCLASFGAIRFYEDYHMDLYHDYSLKAINTMFDMVREESGNDECYIKYRSFLNEAGISLDIRRTRS